MNGVAPEEAPSGAGTGCAAHQAKRLKRSSIGRQDATGADMDCTYGVVCLTGVESQLCVHAHPRPRAAVAALSECGRQYWALAQSFPGGTALRDLPENVLELMFRCCSSTTQVSLAHTSQLFRKYWKTLKLYEGPSGLCVTCRNKHRQQLHDGAAAIASRVNLLIYARRLEGPVLLDMAVYCVCVSGHLGPRLLEYILQQQRLDFESLSQYTVESIMEDIGVEFNHVFGAGELAGEAALLRLKLHHGRQAGLSDDELEKLSSFFASLPAHCWCGQLGLCSICEPVWQLIAPGGTSSSVHWRVARNTVSEVLELPSQW